MAFLAALLPTVLGAVAKGGLKIGAKPRGKRRRRARLSMKEMQELTWIRANLGRTAAAQAMPWYLGRGG